jgi:hypothetical protein
VKNFGEVAIMILELNMQELYYIRALITDDMIEFPDGHDCITAGVRNKLREKIDCIR